MLSHHARSLTPRSSAVSSIIRRAVAVECSSSSPLSVLLLGSSRSYASTSLSASSWQSSGGWSLNSAATRNEGRQTGVACRQRRGVVAQPRQQRRPTVNGQTIPFHVNDLLNHPTASTATTTTTPAKTKSTAATATTAAASVTPSSSFSSNTQQQEAPPRRSYDSDLIVVLDMDECLIHSQFLSTPAAAKVYAHQLQQQRRNSTATNARVVDSFRFSLPDGELVHVNVRPGLLEFLQAVTAKFETHIFTAAMEVYAKPLLDHLDPEGTMFDGLWYREHCVFDAQQQAYVKDLTKLPALNDSLDRVVLVDNNPLSFLANPSNGILVSSFYSDANDKTLSNVWNLLQELDEKAEDVRPHLEERFGLTQALKDIQLESSNNKKESVAAW